MALSVGSRLGHYNVTALIGAGGMGQVYQVADTKLNRQVALKILPEALGGSPLQAREHFHQVGELSGGLDLSPYVSLASGVAVAPQNRAEFESLLESALAIDSDADESIRLANILAQRSAELLLDHIDEVFDPVEEEQEEVR